MTDDLDQAVTHDMLIVSSSVYNGTLRRSHKLKLIDYVAAGGVLVLQKVKDAGLFDLCGINGQVTSRHRYAMTLDLATGHSALERIDDPLEETISLGRQSKYTKVIATRSFELTTAEALAKFDDGSVAVAQIETGKGKAKKNLFYSCRKM